VERTYDELGFVDVLRKRFGEVKNTVGSAGRLKLVVCKGHQRQIDKNNLVPKVIEKQALLQSNDAILIRRFSTGRIVFWNRGAHQLYGWSKKKAMGKPVYNLLQTELPEPPPRHSS
jgi:PAS domain-containing protein